MQRLFARRFYLNGRRIDVRADCKCSAGDEQDQDALDQYCDRKLQSLLACHFTSFQVQDTDLRANAEAIIKANSMDVATAHDVPVMMHCCGSSSWAFEDFIEMGIKVVDTLQPEAADMSPAYLKEAFGGRLCFNGCISTAGPMAYGTADEAVQDLKEVFDIMKPGGGYIMSPTHMLQDNSPTENVVAVYRAALEYGAY